MEHQERTYKKITWNQIHVKGEDLDVLFLTETGLQINNTDDYKLEGYETLFQRRISNTSNWYQPPENKV